MDTIAYGRYGVEALLRRFQTLMSSYSYFLSP